MNDFPGDSHTMRSNHTSFVFFFPGGASVLILDHLLETVEKLTDEEKQSFVEALQKVIDSYRKEERDL